MSDVFDEIESDPTPAPVTPDPPAPRPHDVFDDIEAVPTPQQGMAAAQAAAQGVSAPDAAKAAAVANRVGVDPQAVVPKAKELGDAAQQAFNRAQFEDIAARHPELADWMRHPTNQAIARLDLVNMRALSTALQSINPPVDDRPDLPLTAAFKVGVDRTVGQTNRTLLAGPAWLQDEARSLFGIRSAPNPNTPLGLFYGAQDMATSIQRQRDTWFKPSAMRDLVSQSSGILADPTSALLAPAEGASLAVKATSLIGEAAMGRAAIEGAAQTQAVVAGGQTMVDQATRRQQGQEKASAIADVANVAVQTGLAYFFGKLGQEVPIQRALRTRAFDGKPIADLGEDIVRNAVVGGSQAVAGGAADSVLHGDGVPDAASLASLYASGAIPGGLMAAGNIHEAAIAAHHVTNLRNAEGLTFANKIGDVVAVVRASKAVETSGEQVGQLIDAMVASGRAPDAVYLQAEEWQNHFLGKGLDPVEEAAKAGLQDEYVHARGLGGDMQIPLRTAIGMAADAEEPAALIARMRQAPFAPNAVEAAAHFGQPSPDQIEGAQRLAAEQVAGTGKEPAGSTIRQDREAQAAAAGVSPEEASVFGQIHQRFFQRMAERMNAAREDVGGTEITAQQLADEFRLRIQRVLPDVLRQARDRIAPLLDELRTTGPQSQTTTALRTALARYGLDATTHSNDHILAEIERHARGEAPADGRGYEVSTTVEGHPVVVADVPYGAGTSKDGRTVYIDRRIPRFADIGGQRVDLHEAIALHELHEKPRMDAGESYSEAHAAAQRHEHTHVAEAGIDPAAYEAVVRPYIDAAKAQAKPEGIPRDLEPKPYADSGESERIAGASAPAYEHAPTVAQAEPPAAAGILGSFTPGARESVIRLFEGANRSTLFHETAHYFLDVLSRLGEREGAPKELRDDIAAIMAWSGYGDVATMQRMQAELADLQAKPNPTDADRARMAELAKPHETFARGFEQYLMEGRAPATGLRRAFARIKAWMTAVYREVRDLGVHLSPEVRGVMDRLLASEREIERAKGRAAEAPAFADQASSGMSDREWATYQAAQGEANRQEREALEREVMAHERQAQSEAFASERAEVRGQKADEVGSERVHDAITQLQNDKTWDGRELAEPLKLSRKDVDRLLTPEERKKLPGPGREKNRGRSITTSQDHGKTADEAALLLGYGHGGGLDLLRDLIAAPDREAEIDRRTDDEMAKRHPDPMRNQAVLETAADRALHEPDARSVVHEMERAHLAKLLNAERAAQRDAEQRQGLAAAKGKTDAKTDRQAGKLANALGRQMVAQASTRDERLAMRVAAEAAVRGTRVAGLDPDRYVAAERRAALAVAKALAQKDFATALTQKRAQMMNAELARAAHAAAEQAGKDRSRLLKLAFDAKERTKIAKAGGLEWTVTAPDGTTRIFDRADDQGQSAQEQARAEAERTGGTFDRTSGYLEQIDALLERYELKPVSGRKLAQRETMRAFLERVLTQRGPDGEPIPSGVYADIPAHLVDDARRVNVAELTVQDLHDLRSTAEGIAKLAKQVGELMSTTRQERIDDLAIGVAEQARKTGKKTLPGPVRRFIDRHVAGGDGTTGGILTKPLRAIGNFFDELMQVPRLCYEMDGFQEGGTVAKAFLFPAIEAGDRELTMKAAIREKVSAAVKEWGKTSGYTRESVPGLVNPKTKQPWRLTLLDRITTLMHYGNPEGRQRLADLNGWDDAAVHRIVDSLDAKDIAFANRMVDVLSSHWSDVKALEERYNGIAPPKVDAIPVELPNGSYKGGYQRIYYDGESATKLEQMAEQLRDEGMIGQGYRRPTTPHGATKERVQVVKDRVLSLDAGNWTRALNEMAHDLTHRDVVHDQMRLLNHPEVRAAMQDAWGVGTWKQFVNQTLGLAQGSKPAVTAGERVAEYLRLCTNYSRRAFNPAYALIQEAGLPLARTRVGDKYLIAAQAQLWSGPLCLDHTAHWIAEQSPTMKYRARTRDALIGDAMSETVLASGMRKFMDGAGMAMVLKTWEHMDNVVWMGAYNQHRAEQAAASHDDAVKVANQVVESLMGSNKQKDIPQIMRAGGPAMKVFTSNMTWALANWNNIATEWNRTAGGLRRYGQGGWGQMAKGLAGLATTCVIGPMLWDWLYDLTKGADMASWQSGESLLHKAWTAPFYSAMSSIPLLRDIEPSVVEGRDGGGGTTGLHWLQAIDRAGAAAHAKTYDERTVKAVAGAAGTFLPLPTAAIFNAIDGFKQAQREGDGFPGTVWRMANGPTPRAPKE